MGNSKSDQFGTLVQQYDSNRWLVLDDRQTHQLWQSTISHKRYMAYVIEYSQINSEDKLQLYHFRKLNHANIVTIHSIISNESQFLCSQPKNYFVLVENIPLRLATFRKSFNFHQGLTILSSIFSGYNTINYVFGPLYTNEDMIGFTESGVTKVWINQNFASNQPSKSARYDSTDMLAPRIGQQNLEIQTFKCVQKIISVVQECIVGGFSSQFKRQMANVKTFAGGEEFIQGFCKSRGIQLNQTVPLDKVNRVQPLKFINKSLSSERNLYEIQNSNRISINAQYEPMKTQNSTNYVRTQITSVPRSARKQIPQQSQMLLSSKLIKGNSKIHITFNHQSPCTSLVLNQPSNLSSHKGEVSLNKTCIVKLQKEVPQVNKNNQLSEALRKEVNAVQSIQQIGSHTQQEQKQQERGRQEVLIVEEVNHELQNQQEEGHDLKRLKTIQSKQQLQLKSMGQSSHLSVDQIQKWQESLLRISDKQKSKLQKINKPIINYKSSNQSQDHYLSQQRDKVELPDSKEQLPFYTGQTQVQAYVRNKYKDYIKSEKSYEEIKLKNNYNDNIKYTFGKIQIEPSLAVHQHNKADIKIKSGSFRDSKSKNISTGLSLDNKFEKRCSIEERYIKYVKNRQPNNFILSKTLNSIQKTNDSQINGSKRQNLEYRNSKDNENRLSSVREEASFTANQKAQNSNHNIKISNLLQGKSLTYDKLRQFLRN